MTVIFQKYEKNSFKVLLEFIYFSIVLHALIMLFQFYSKDFKDFVLLYTSTGQYSSSFAYDFRMGGLSGGPGGSVLSVVQSIGILIIPFILNNSTKIKKIFILLFSLLIIHSILVCGRSGLWSVILFTPLSIYLANGKLGYLTTIKIFTVIVICATLIFSIADYVNKLNDSDPIYLAFGRTLSTFINFKENGNYEDETVNQLMQQTFLPSDVKILAFGNGEYIVDRGLKSTLNADAGYIVNLWGLGIIGLMIYLLPIVKYFFISFKYRRIFAPASLLFLLSIIMLFFHLKELYLYARMFFSIYSLSIACLYIYKEKGINLTELKLS